MVEITTEAVGISQWRTKTALGCAVTILTLVLANCVGIQYENLSSRENGSIYDQAQKYSARMTSGGRGVGFKAEQGIPRTSHLVNTSGKCNNCKRR